MNRTSKLAIGNVFFQIAILYFGVTTGNYSVASISGALGAIIYMLKDVGDK